MALIAASSEAHAQSVEDNWELDSSFLSYRESDDRVSVLKTLLNLEKQGEASSWRVNLINDTMSGASPTGAIRSSDSAVTFTGASGDRTGSSDYSMSTFEDTRRQAGVDYSRQLYSGFEIGVGGALSQESDYDSTGGNVDLSFTTDSKLTTYEIGLAATSDTIYRSDTLGTPEPLSNVQSPSPYSEGSRTTIDTLLGVTRVLNKQTLVQFNLTFSQSEGYHSDPYKIISAADENDRIYANFHDSRPQSRQRASVFTKLVHQISDSNDSVRLSYRWYQDDWGVASHTIDTRLRHILNRQQFIEPHIRLYRQSSADFYQRKLGVDTGNNPILPDDRIASSDYRLDDLSSVTVGLKYGYALTRNSLLRVRAEYLTQRYATADYGSLDAVIFQTSLNFRF